MHVLRATGLDHALRSTLLDSDSDDSPKFEVLPDAHVETASRLLSAVGWQSERSGYGMYVRRFTIVFPASFCSCSPWLALVLLVLVLPYSTNA